MGYFDEVDMQYRRWCKVFYHNDFHTILVEGTPNLLNGLGAGTPSVLANSVAASELAAVALDSNDEVYCLLDLAEFFVNRETDFSAQLCFEVAGTSETGIDFSMHMKGIVAGAAFSDAKSSADKSITFAAAVNTLAGELVITERRSFGFKKGSTHELVSDDMIQFAITLDDKGTAAANEIHLHSVRIFGETKMSSSSGSQEKA